SGPKARANGPKGPKTKAQSSAHGDQTSNHFEIDICSGLFSIALSRKTSLIMRMFIRCAGIVSPAKAGEHSPRG
ncbi:hypothetical protein V4C53_47155, partial [Paraburkholderia azotifigens]|uniref:hypothetical protein n=1 Tax=Paraburkholderia azotifigens TaxID=2057004 RepID=UPI003177FCDF